MQHLKWLSYVVLPHRLFEFSIAWLPFLATTAASLFSGNQASKAATGAANATAAGSQAAIDSTEKMYYQNRLDQEPWRKAGATALDALMSMVGLPGDGYAKGGNLDQLMNFGENNLTPTEQQQLSQNLLQRGSSYSAREPEPNDMQWRPRATGGPVSQGKYVVGEDGPEVLTMHGDGTGYVTPNPRTVANSMGYLPGREMGGNVATSGYQTEMPGNDGGQLQNYYAGQGADMAPQMLGPPQAQGGQAVNYGAGPTPENPGGQPGRYNFMSDPGYNFRRQEGVRAADMSASSRGQLLSGGHLKALTRYGQDYASAEYQNVYNRISNIAGLGQTATSQTGALGANAANQIGGYQQNAGNARASGYLGSSNAWGNAINQGINLYGALQGMGTQGGTGPLTDFTRSGGGAYTDLLEWPPGSG